MNETVLSFVFILFVAIAVTGFVLGLLAYLNTNNNYAPDIEELQNTTNNNASDIEELQKTKLSLTGGTLTGPLAFENEISTWKIANDRDGTLAIQSSTKGWSKDVDVPSASTATCVAMSTNGQFQIIGGDSIINTSTDYGQTWTSVSISPDVARCVSISNDGTKACYVTFNTNKVFTSNDGGLSWSNENNSVSQQWICVYLSGNGNIYVANGVDGVSISKDNGVTWINTFGFFASQLAINEDGSYINIGYGFTAYQSTDEGATWNIIGANITGTLLLFVSMSQSGQVQLLADSSPFPRMWLSTDFGANFVNITQPDNMRVQHAVVSGDGKHIVIALIDSIPNGVLQSDIYTSIDNGVSWTKQNTVMLDIVSTFAGTFSVSFDATYGKCIMIPRDEYAPGISTLASFGSLGLLKCDAQMLVKSVSYVPDYVHVAADSSYVYSDIVSASLDTGFSRNRNVEEIYIYGTLTILPESTTSTYLFVPDGINTVNLPTISESLYGRVLQFANQSNTNDITIASTDPMYVSGSVAPVNPYILLASPFTLVDFTASALGWIIS